MLGFIPSRFSEFTSYLDVLSRNGKRGSKDAIASKMTKWFNIQLTHYIVPEYEEGLQSL